MIPLEREANFRVFADAPDHSTSSLARWLSLAWIDRKLPSHEHRRRRLGDAEDQGPDERDREQLGDRQAKSQKRLLQPGDELLLLGVANVEAVEVGIQHLPRDGPRGQPDLEERRGHAADHRD